MPEKNSAKSSNLIAILLLATILAALAGVFWSNGRESAIAGPNAIARDSAGGILFNAAGQIYHLDADGNLLQRQWLTELGISGTVSDLDTLGDELLLADGKGGVIHRCLPGNCRTFISLKTTPAVMPTALQMAWSDDRQILYTISAFSHRIDAYGREGNHLYQLHTKSRLFTPNDIVASSDGTLAIADTDNRRIVVIRDLGDGESEEVQAFTTRNRLTPLRYFPLSLVRDAQGRFWAILGDKDYRHGSVVVFSADGEAELSVPLEYGADPIALVSSKAGVLVADFDGFRLSLISPDGNTIRPVTSEPLTSELDSLRQEKGRFKFLRYGLIGLMVLSLVGAIFISSKEQARKREAEKRGRGETGGDGFNPNWREVAAVYPELEYVNGILWMSPAHAMVKQLRQIRLFAYVALAVALGGSALFALGGASLKLLAAVAPLVLLFVLMETQLRSLFGYRLGTDGRNLYTKTDAGQVVGKLPQDVIRSRRLLIIGEQVLMVMNNYNKMVFPEEPYRHYFKPLIERAAAIGELAVAVHLFRIRHRPTLVATFIVAIMLAVLVVAKFEHVLPVADEEVKSDVAVSMQGIEEVGSSRSLPSSDDAL